MVLKKSNKKRACAHMQSHRRFERTRQQAPHAARMQNTRLGNPKRVFGNDVSMRLADPANLNVLLVFVNLGKIAQARALDHVGAGGHREAQGVLNTLGGIVPHGQEGSE